MGPGQLLVLSLVLSLLLQALSEHVTLPAKPNGKGRAALTLCHPAALTRQDLIPLLSPQSLLMGAAGSSLQQAGRERSR